MPALQIQCRQHLIDLEVARTLGARDACASVPQRVVKADLIDFQRAPHGLVEFQLIFKQVDSISQLRVLVASVKIEISRESPVWFFRFWLKIPDVQIEYALIFSSRREDGRRPKEVAEAFFRRPDRLPLRS